MIGANLLTYRQIIFNVPHFENTTLPQVWDPGHERQPLGQDTFLELDGKQVTGRFHTLENTVIFVVRRQLRQNSVYLSHSESQMAVSDGKRAARYAQVPASSCIHLLLFGSLVGRRCVGE